jgi:hypothetical protein
LKTPGEFSSGVFFIRGIVSRVRELSRKMTLDC